MTKYSDIAHNELKEILDLLKDNLGDLEEWSANNDDMYNEEISVIKQLLEGMI